jgi:hypothetical protein
MYVCVCLYYYIYCDLQSGDLLMGRLVSGHIVRRFDELTLVVKVTLHGIAKII